MLQRSASVLAGLFLLSAVFAGIRVVRSESAAASASAASAGERLQKTLEVGGEKRTYILRLPSGYDSHKPLPLVVMLHGRGGSGAITERAYGWAEKAEKERFIVAFPDALPDPTGKPTWRSGAINRPGAPDDVAFLRSLISSLKNNYAVDPKRVYVCGHSSGGLMSYRIGAEMAPDLAAIGVCAGSIGNTLGNRRSTIPQPTAPLPVIHIHGKKDSIVGYDGTSERFRIGFIPAPESVAFWAKADGCKSTPTRKELSGGSVTQETWSGCKDNAEVTLYTLRDGEHNWPGGRLRALRSGGSELNATDVMWDFFKAHPRP